MNVNTIVCHYAPFLVISVQKCKVMEAWIYLDDVELFIELKE